MTPDSGYTFLVFDETENGRIGQRDLVAGAIALVAAIVAYALPFTRFILSVLVTLFHEFGHAVVAWAFGHPSIPAFDFVYGGGFTNMGAFRTSVAVAIALGFGYLAWLYRGRPRTVAVLVALFALWLVFVSAEWRRELVISAAGHAFELILAAAFLYMALSGTGLRAPEVERPLAAFAGFFVTIHTVLFARRLRNDPDFLATYREGKGGAMMNDLEVVALDLHIHLGWNPGIEGVAAMLMLFALLPVTAALYWHLRRERCHRFMRSLLT